MIIVVGGGRDLTSSGEVFSLMDYWLTRLGFTNVVHRGMVTIHPDDRDTRVPWDRKRKWGVDHFVDSWARSRQVAVSVEQIEDADLKRLGASAAAALNKRILDKYKPERCLTFPGGPETDDLLKQARVAGIRCIEASGQVF